MNTNQKRELVLKFLAGLSEKNVSDIKETDKLKDLGVVHISQLSGLAIQTGTDLYFPNSEEKTVQDLLDQICGS